ncbi:MAG: HD-GYP domain-containing protein, partial [Candidatus Eremiobacterota bacterium]
PLARPGAVAPTPLSDPGWVRERQLLSRLDELRSIQQRLAEDREELPELGRQAGGPGPAAGGGGGGSIAPVERVGGGGGGGTYLRRPPQEKARTGGESEPPTNQEGTQPGRATPVERSEGAARGESQDRRGGRPEPDEPQNFAPAGQRGAASTGVSNTRHAPRPEDPNRQYQVTESASSQGGGEGGGGGGGDAGDGGSEGGNQQGGQRDRSQTSRPGQTISQSGATPAAARDAEQKTRVAVRQVALTRESYQLALRKLDLTNATRVTEAVVSRHVSHSLTSILKRVYREQDLDNLDAESAVNDLGVLLKLGGEFTFAHSARVLDYAMDLADQVGIQDRTTRSQVRYGALLKDIGDVGVRLNYQPEQTLDELGRILSSPDMRRAGLLHDLGKVKVPKEILYKPGRLTPEEFQIMKMHPVYGAEMVYPIRCLRHLCPTIRGHHERWDGQGYPDGLKGQDIPLPARIIAVADVFDALAAPRPYKDGMDVRKVWEILKEGKASHFDPQLVDAFGKVLRRRYPEHEFA